MRTVGRDRIVSVVVLAASAIACAGCIERRDELPSASCGEDPAPPTWTRVSAEVMRPSCGTVACHSTLSRKAGVVLDSAAAGYPSLMNAEPEPFVRAGEPAASRLMYLLIGGEVEKLMPPDAPLADVEIELVGRWICAGARDD